MDEHTDDVSQQENDSQADKSADTKPKPSMGDLMKTAAQYAAFSTFVNDDETARNAKDIFSNTLFTPKLAENDPYKETEKYGKDIIEDLKSKLYTDKDNGIHINIIESIESYFEPLPDTAAYELKQDAILQKRAFISSMVDKFTESVSELISDNYDPI